MLEVLILAGAVVIFRRQLRALGPTVRAKAKPAAPPTPKHTSQITQLAEYADRLYAEKKWLAAEKAYLNVLKADHKNVTAYSHLGVIYSTQKNFADAIECFEIATQLWPSANTYQNLGLALFENRNPNKAIAAFEKAVTFEPNTQRYIGLSKAYKKIGNKASAIAALEKAAELDPAKKVLQLLAEAYDDAGRKTDAEATTKRIQQTEPAPPPKP